MYGGFLAEYAQKAEAEQNAVNAKRVESKANLNEVNAEQGILEVCGQRKSPELSTPLRTNRGSLKQFRAYLCDKGS